MNRKPALVVLHISRRMWIFNLDGRPVPLTAAVAAGRRCLRMLHSWADCSCAKLREETMRHRIWILCHARSNLLLVRLDERSVIAANLLLDDCIEPHVDALGVQIINVVQLTTRPLERSMVSNRYAPAA